jgi:hypothetical protein
MTDRRKPFLIVVAVYVALFVAGMAFLGGMVLILEFLTRMVGL